MEKDEERKYREIGRRIEGARSKEGLTQGQLAEKLNYQTPTAISLIEAGKRKIKIGELEKIAKLLHQDLQFLLTGSTDRPISVRMALRAEYKDLTKPELDKIESFINFVKSEQRERRDRDDQPEG